MSEPHRLLFVCTHNLSRSYTAETLFLSDPRYVVRSAGTHAEARVPVSEELVRWAETIMVMEQHHAEALLARFPDAMAGRFVTILEIPDVYQPHEEALKLILRTQIAISMESQDAG